MPSPRYSKAKGRQFQNDIKKLIQLYAVQRGLVVDDVESAIMGENGVDIKLSPAMRKQFPFSLECKRVEKLNVYAAYEQSKQNHYDNTIPAVVWKRNNKNTLITMDLLEFMALFMELMEERDEAPRVPSKLKLSTKDDS